MVLTFGNRIQVLDKPACLFFIHKINWIWLPLKRHFSTGGQANSNTEAGFTANFSSQFICDFYENRIRTTLE